MMADDKNIPNEDANEEEYQFSDEDIDKELAGLDESEQSDDDELSGAAVKASWKEKLKNVSRRQKVIIAFAMMVVLFVLIKITGGGSTPADDFSVGAGKQVPATVGAITSDSDDAFGQSKSNTLAARSSAAKTQAKTLTLDQLSNAQPKVTSSPLSSLTTVSKSRQNGEAWQQQVQSLGKDNQQLQGQVKQLNTKVVGMETTLTRINNQLSTLLSQAANPQQEVQAKGRASAVASSETYEQQIQQQQTYAQQQKKVREFSYSVQAVIPGRAWLQSSNGETSTVTVGDDLAGYGQVVAIDPYSGKVTTSSGRMIVYGN